MAQLTQISQESRAPKCRKCYVNMQKHGVLDFPVLGVTEKKPKKEKAVDYDWQCPKCGLRHEVRGATSKTVIPS